MNFRKSCFAMGAAAMTLMASVSVAAPITDLVTVNGREWAQPNQFLGFTWNQVSALCPAATCSGQLNGYDLSGWTWATALDASALLHAINPAFPDDQLIRLSSPDPLAQTIATNFFDAGFNPTFEIFSERYLVAMTSEQLAPDRTRALLVLDPLPPSNGDDVVSTSVLTSAGEFGGAATGFLFYRTPVTGVPVPGSLLLLGAALGAWRLVSRSRRWNSLTLDTSC